MLVLHAYIEVAPGDRDTINGALPALVTATRAEDGCEEYSCFEEVGQPGRYVFVERWRDREALDRHLASAHIAAWRAVARPLLKSTRLSAFDAAPMELARK